MGAREKARNIGFESILDSIIKNELLDYMISEKEYQFFNPPDIMSAIKIAKDCMNS